MAKEKTREKSLGREVLDKAKYAGKVLLMMGAIGSLGLILTTRRDKRVIEQEVEKAHLYEVNYEYGKIFKNAYNFQDSVDIYQKYGLPIKLLEPSLEQKEKAIKQNRLENLIAQ